ncbi:hypothetical protein ACK8N7_26485 [Streptomyces griseobrunneus]
MNWGYARSWAASLGWGDWPAWLACLFALIALWISIRAQRDGRRSANASETSATAAQESVEEARLSRIASERSATVAEETLADQRREAAGRRAAEEEANRPRPRFQIEKIGRYQYQLRNVGTGPATGITVTPRTAPYRMDAIDNVALMDGEAFPFTMMSADGLPVPRTLYAVWDGQVQEVALTVLG